MKRPFALALPAAVLLAAVLLAAPTALAQDKIRIAVVDFDTDALQNGWHYGWSYTNLARAASDGLVSELVKTNKFRMIERAQLDKVLAEQNLGEAGRIDPSTAAKVGKILGVQLVIIGAVTEFGVSDFGGRIPQLGKLKGWTGMGGKVVTGKGALTARVVDTTTAEILGAYEGKGSTRFGQGEFAGIDLGTNYDSGIASKVLAEAVKQLAQDIAGGASKLTPSTERGGIEGKVAKVEGDKVYLNVGGGSGIKVGDRFEIRSVGEQIKDPDSGEVLGGEEETIGEVEVTKVVNDKLSLAKIVSGKGFAAGNRAVMK